MDKSIGSPSLAYMAMLYGPRTEQEIDAALVPFRKLRNEYRRRFKEDGIALTRNEAVEAYKLVVPLYAPDMTDEEATRQASMHAITFPCLQTGTFGFREPAVKAILEGFERMIAEGSQTLHIRRPGEAEAREVDPWSRFVAYKALEHYVEVWSRLLHCDALEHLVEVSSGRQSFGDWIFVEPPSAFYRAINILAAVTETRPRGRHNPRLTLRRNAYIVTMLLELEGCGLPVTSSGGNSLAGALAEALGERERTIRDVWSEFPLRESQLNDALPAELRLPESLIRRRRNPDPEKPRIAPDVHCARCGKAGKVPVYRAREGGSRVCTDCEEW